MPPQHRRGAGGFELGEARVLAPLGAEGRLQVFPQARRAHHRLLDLHGDDAEAEPLLLGVPLGDLAQAAGQLRPLPVRRIVEDERPESGPGGRRLR